MKKMVSYLGRYHLHDCCIHTQCGAHAAAASNLAARPRLRAPFRSTGLLALFIMILCFGIAQGQTEWKDNYASLAINDQTNPSIARPSNTGFTIVVWEDSRDSGEIRTDIYAQKIDNVNGLPMWLPVDGVPVCTAAYNQRNPRAAYDSLGHVLVVWED